MGKTVFLLKVWSIRVLVAGEGQQQNLEIEPRGPVLDVVKVVFDAIDETRIAAMNASGSWESYNLTTRSPKMP